jgi:hypothetical protein
MKFVIMRLVLVEATALLKWTAGFGRKLTLVLL